VYVPGVLLPGVQMHRTRVLIAISAVVAVVTTTAAPIARAGSPQLVHPDTDVQYTANFEATGGINVGDQITNQYPFVTFDSFNVTGYGFGFGSAPANKTIAINAPENPIVTASGAHSGSDSGQIACPSEFCTSGTFGVLNYSADSISVYAGDDSPVSETVELDAYDASGNYLGSDTATSPGGGANTLLSYTSAGAPIAFFVVSLGHAGNGNALDIDDLTISVPSGAAPTVGVTAGASGYELGQDGTIQVPLTVHRVNGATGSVSIAVGGSTSDVTAAATQPGTGNSATLTVSASHTAPLSDVPLTLTASATDTVSQAAATVTITVVVPLTLVAPASRTSQICGSSTLQVEAQVAPGEPGSQVTFSTGFSSSAPGLSASVTSPVTISGGLADATVNLSSTGGGSNTTLLVTAMLSNGDGKTVGVSITRQGPTITSVDAIDQSSNGTPFAGNVAMTPRAEGNGSTIEIYGHGFCNSAVVQVGNALATVSATPQHLSTEDYIRIETPRLATSGPVTVTVGSPAASVTSTDKLTVDSYRNVDAWSFQNFDPYLTFDDLTQAFGAKQTYVQMDLCGFLTLGLGSCAFSIVPDPLAEMWLGIAQATASTGTCFGFSLSTQRILEGEASLSSLPGNPKTIFDAPQPDESAVAQSMHGTSPVMDLLKSAHLMQFSTEFMTSWLNEIADINGQDLADSSQVTPMLVGDIEKVFKAGRYPLIEIQDQGGHVLVAYDLKATGGGNYDIYVYDSNGQFTSDENDAGGVTHQTRLDNSVIHLAADGTWSLASTTESGGGPWHAGIGQLVVTDPATVPLHPTLASFGGGAPTGAIFSSKSGPGSTQSSRASAATITQVSSGGKTLYASDGSLNMTSTRLNAAPFGPFVASPSTSPATQLIAVGGKVNDLTVSTKGRTNGPGAMTFAHGGYVGQISTGTATGAVQTDSFNSTSGSVGVKGSLSGPVTLGVTQGTGQGSHTVSLAVAKAGTADNLTVGSKGSVNFLHDGGSTTVALTLSAAGADALPKTLTTKSLQVGSGQKVSINGITWTKLGATVTVHIGGRTLKLHTTSRATKAATIQHLSVTSAAKHKTKLAITAQLPKLAAGSQVELVWLVHRGHHRVATHVVGLTTFKRREHLSWTTRLKKARGLTFTALIVTIAVHGAAESSAAHTRSKSFRVT
jgi:hypothetical protein